MRLRSSRIPATVLDQAILSGGNFASLVLLARLLSPRHFGVFVLVYAGLTFANGLQTAVVTTPHNVIGSVRVGAPRYAAYTRAMASVQVLVTSVFLLLLVVFGAIALPLGVTDLSLVAGAALALVGWQGQEFARRVLYSEGRTGAAVVSDVVSYGGQVVVLALLGVLHAVTVASAFVAIGVTSLAGLAFAATLLRGKLLPRPEAEHIWESWKLGRWLLGGTIAYWCSTDLYLYVAAAVLGVAASGGLKAAQALLGPLSVLLIFIGTNLPITFARAISSDGKGAVLRSKRTRAGRNAIASVLVYGLVLSVAAHPLLDIVYGKAYGRFAVLVPLFVAYYAVASFASVLSASLTAQHRPDLVFRANLAGSFAALCVGWPFVLLLGVKGAVIGMLCSRGIQAVLLRRAVGRTERDRVQGADDYDRTAVLISYHYFESKRKAGFHWLAEAYSALGWRVVFVTAPISRLSQAMRDYRFGYPVIDERGRLRRVRERTYSFVFFTVLHPANMRFGVLNRISRPLVWLYSRAPLGALEGELRRAELIIFESTAALVLAPRVRRINPRAKLVYRVSDDLERVRAHPAIVGREEELAQVFDLVSVPSPVLYERFAHLEHSEYRPHGVWHEFFDVSTESPYSGGPNACFVGNSDLDAEFLRIAVASTPGLTFHVIGDLGSADIPDGVRVYGEMPFTATVPFIKFADVGIQCISRGVRGETRASLKTLQFAYCGLPIVSPDFLPTEFPRTYTYVPGNERSIGEALGGALRAGRGRPAGVGSWLDVALALAPPPAEPSLAEYGGAMPMEVAR